MNYRFSFFAKCLLLLSGLLLLLAPAGARTVGWQQQGSTSAVAQVQTAANIAFISSGTNGGDIYLVSSDGSGLTNITQGRLTGIAAFAWSPDGAQLVVSADRGSNLYVVAADGTNMRAVTHNTGFAITQTPTWSPDGTQIAYIGNATQNYDVFLINPDGTNARRLTNTNAIYRDLAWSPDGRRIAYASGDDFFHVHIYTMRADGSTPTQVSTGGGSDSAPAWSPDGTRLVYQNDFQFGPSEIFTSNADGSNQTRITNNFFSDAHPTWSPDGVRIAFSTNRDSIGTGTTRYAIYSMSTDGSNQTRLTDLALSAVNPAWQPIPPPLAVGPVLITEVGTARAVALDSVTLMRDPLPVLTAYNFSSDRHTRALFFVGNIDPVALANGLPVTVQLTAGQGRVLVLTPESSNPVANLAGVAQLIVRLPDELGGGDVSVRVTVNGVLSNSAACTIKPTP